MKQNYFETIDYPFFAADFDYFRLPREKWELMLVRLRQMGVQAVTITLPWGFHEFSRGVVDLNGATRARRNLVGLLHLCAAFELPCILKPGPYNYQGVLGEGIPLWLLKNDDFESVLLLAVEAWYKALSKTLTGQQWPDGPVIALYINSEPSEGFSPAKSKQLTEVKWRIWLRKRYDGIEALNTAYGSNYRTVNDVEFPATWSQGNTPLERDARQFLEKVRVDAQTRYTELLMNAGWQIPIYPSAKDIYHNLPAFQTCSLANVEELSSLSLAVTVLNLNHPIQVDPDPADVGQGTVWASQAPIRPDGSLRRKFWQVRQFLWQHLPLKASLKGKISHASFTAGSLITGASDAPVEIDLAPRTKPAAYRLRLNGELVVEDNFKTKRGKLSGTYLAEDEAGQTDVIFILANAAAPASGFPLTYLRRLLAAQAETLTRSAALAEALGQMLTPTQDSPAEDIPPDSAHTLNTLAEARRGLSEADAALRRAIDSISGLEEGFATILKQSSLELPPQPAPPPVAITPDILDGAAREQLINIGLLCAKLAPALKSAATTLKRTIDAAGGFTVDQYQAGWATAVEAARAARPPLLKALAQLRLEIAAGRLPLVMWRVHDQVQEIVESLRWGVLRQ